MPRELWVGAEVRCIYFSAPLPITPREFPLLSYEKITYSSLFPPDNI